MALFSVNQKETALETNSGSVLISKTKTEKVNPATYCGDQD